MIRLTPFKLAIVAAFGIAMAPAPAAADRDDVAKIIAGLAVAGIVAKVIDDRKEKNRNSGVSSRLAPRYDSFDERRRPGTYTGTLRRLDEGRRSNRGYKQYALPDQCLRILDTNRGDRRVYARHCLKRNYAFSNKLPRACEIRVRTERGIRTVYGRRCLARDGWEVAGRRR